MPNSADPSIGDALRRGRVARAAWMTLGLVLVGIGIVGIVVPLLPTVDFMLLALPCFARSSPRLEAWLLGHPRFGPPLRAWRHERAVPRHVKFMAIGGMAFGYGLFVFHVQPGLPLALPVAAVLLFWAVWIARRPEPGMRR
ncbi:YbaN family protein [Novosphingobium sp. ZW T3_23]|uniref:YbaN family protein n=1 Tax=Novosphingobium sp. ZW T3_23 TaxID=3378084 RepID=UPI00385263E1